MRQLIVDAAQRSPVDVANLARDQQDRRVPRARCALEGAVQEKRVGGRRSVVPDRRENRDRGARCETAQPVHCQRKTPSRQP